MFTTFHASNWHPLTWLSHAIDYAIWGLNPVGHHLTSIIFHGLNTFLVVNLTIRLVNYAKTKTDVNIENIRHFYNSPIIAGVITGLLFGLHPIHVESVAWVAERKDVLYAFFFLLSLLSYLKYIPSQKQESTGHSSPITRHQWYSLCLLFFILSLMSKPMAVTLPFILIILDIYPLGRLDLKSAFTSQYKVSIEKIPFLSLSLVSSVITILAQKSGEAMASSEIHPLIERFLVGIRALCFYLIKMFRPIDLAPLYPYPAKVSFFTIEYTGSVILVLSITVFCIYSWKKQKIWPAAWAYYLVTLLPVLGIVMVGEQAAADRYTYLPSLGPFLLIGVGLAQLIEKSIHRKHNTIFRKLSAIILMTTILLLLSNLTIKQTRIWRDSMTLWNSELRIFPDSAYKAFCNRGKAFADSGNYQKAMEDYEKAIKLNPFRPWAYVNRGIINKKLGNYQKAIEDYNMAIMIMPKYKTAYITRGTVHEASGNYQKAIEDYDMAIKSDPKDADAYYNRGISYGSLGNYQQALTDFTTAIKLNPRYATAYNNRGVFYSVSGNYRQSIEDFNSAIKLQPGYAEAYYNRGISYKNIGSYQKAIQDFTVTIRLNPQHTKAYNSRGNIYLKSGNYQNALRDFQTAARLGNKIAQDYLKSKEIGW